MGLFDLFSNDSAEKAAGLANQGLVTGYNQLSDLYGQGRDAILSGYGKAADLSQGALNLFQPGAQAYGDATGAGGVEGLQRSTDLFKNSGLYGQYGFTNDQAQQAIARAHGAAGNLSSGNTDTDAAKYAAGLAGNTWGQWVSGLQPYIGATQGAVNTLGNVYTGQAGALNTSFQNQGGAANAEQTGIGKNLAGAELNNYQVGSNQLNALLGVAKAGVNAYSGGLGNLFSGFGSK